MRQRAAASLLYQSQHAEPAFRNLQNLIFLKIVGRILAFYTPTKSIWLQSSLKSPSRTSSASQPASQPLPSSFVRRMTCRAAPSSRHSFKETSSSLRNCPYMTEKVQSKSFSRAGSWERQAKLCSLHFKATKSLCPERIIHTPFISLNTQTASRTDGECYSSRCPPGPMRPALKMSTALPDCLQA